MTTVIRTGTGSPITVSGLAAGNYTVTVQAINAVGTGPTSNAASVTVAPDRGPSTGNLFTQFQLWNDPSNAKTSDNASRYGDAAPWDYMYVNEGGALTPGYPYPGRAAAIRALNVADAVPQARWFYSGGSGDVSAFSAYISGASTAGRLPVAIIYWIPDTDGGGRGPTQSVYEAWIDSMAAAKQAVSSTYPVVAIIEPDALPMLNEISSSQTVRLQCLDYACKWLSAAGITCYLDCGNSSWNSPAITAPNMVSAGVQYCRGFSTNVSNFCAVDLEVAYGNGIASRLSAAGYPAAAHQVIDTGRNGLGSWSGGRNPQYNPPGRAMGQLPSADVHGGTAIQDAALWLKSIAYTDLQGLRSPSDSSSVPDYVVDMATRTSWLPGFTTMPSTMNRTAGRDV